MTGTFPVILKIAKVIPFFKKEDHSLCTNYQPISLLISLMYEKQFGFRNNCLSLDHPPPPFLKAGERINLITDYLPWRMGVEGGWWIWNFSYLIYLKVSYFTLCKIVLCFEEKLSLSATTILWRHVHKFEAVSGYFCGNLNCYILINYFLLSEDKPCTNYKCNYLSENLSCSKNDKIITYIFEKPGNKKR